MRLLTASSLWGPTRLSIEACRGTRETGRGRRRRTACKSSDQSAYAGPAARLSASSKTGPQRLLLQQAGDGGPMAVTMGGACDSEGEQACVSLGATQNVGRYGGDESGPACVLLRLPSAPTREGAITL
jgi:hypothetical protein